MVYTCVSLGNKEQKTTVMYLAEAVYICLLFLITVCNNFINNTVFMRERSFIITRHSNSLNFVQSILILAAMQSEQPQSLLTWSLSNESLSITSKYSL